jgi:hypothetical protein
MGPNNKDCGTDVNPNGIHDPEQLRFDNIGSYNNKVVTLIVTNESKYISNEGKCGKGATNNGRKVQFGRINLGNSQSCEFKYAFIYNETGLAVEIPEFSMSFFDFDHGTLCYGVNSVDANGNKAAVLNTTMVTPEIPEGATKAQKNAVKAQVDSLRELCDLVYDNSTGTPRKIANGPGQAFAGGGKTNRNGLDGVKEVMRSEDYSSYKIVNDGVMCDARGGSANDGSYLKITVPDTDINVPTGGYSPVGDPTFSWLQSAGQYCQAGRYDTTSWMYTNYPCTEVATRIMGDGRREFSSTMRGYGCDNPSDPVSLTATQEARRVRMTYTNKKAINIEYEVQSSSCYSYFTGGRNFLFTGQSQSLCNPPAAPPVTG